jgi:hypothetical protein
MTFAHFDSSFTDFFLLCPYYGILGTGFIAIWRHSRGTNDADIHPDAADIDATSPRWGVFIGSFKREGWHDV